MRICGTHLVLETKSDTLDHVVDMGASGTDTCVMLEVTKPDGDFDLILTSTGEFNWNRIEGTLKGTTGTGNLNITTSQGNLDVIGNLD